jgi:DeoR/GlpR family transcriptional regulator of sugar metabolism
MTLSKGLKIDQRRKRILDILSRNGQVRVSELSAELGATPVTIRSDLSALGENGYLERIAGGAVPRVRNIYNGESQTRKPENQEVKKRIAAAAAELIRDGETLFINSGTTTYYTAIELKRRKNLNVVTNSIPIALELGSLPSFRVILLGGDINAHYSFIYGNNALEQLRRFRADKTILSIDGIRPGEGLTTYHAEEAVVNRTMIERSGETIIVADQSKLGRESFSFVAGLSSVSCLVTNAQERDAPHLAELEKTGIKIILAR